MSQHTPSPSDILDARRTADHQLITGQITRQQHDQIHKHLDGVASRLGYSSRQSKGPRDLMAQG